MSGLKDDGGSVTIQPWMSRGLVWGAWGWILLVLGASFWRVWEIPNRFPESTEVGTLHVWLFPVSLFLFIGLSWLRQQKNEVPDSDFARMFSRWRAVLAIWILVLLHPVSCEIYPAVYDIDQRTVDGITQAVGAMRIGMTRTEVEQQILTLNAKLPIAMSTNKSQHQANQRAVEEFLVLRDQAERERRWPALARTILVFVPWDDKGTLPPLGGREQLFQRQLRKLSNFGIDRIRVHYDASDKVEDILYSSNRPLTEMRSACTIHMAVPAPPGTSFPYPCPE